MKSCFIFCWNVCCDKAEMKVVKEFVDELLGRVCEWSFVVENCS